MGWKTLGDANALIANASQNVSISPGKSGRLKGLLYVSQYGLTPWLMVGLSARLRQKGDLSIYLTRRTKFLAVYNDHFNIG